MTWREEETPEQDEIDDEADHESEEDQLPCPSCGRMMYEDSDRCPYCGDWVMPLAAAAAKRKTWIWWTALGLAVIIFIAWGLLG